MMNAVNAYNRIGLARKANSVVAQIAYGRLIAGDGIWAVGFVSNGYSGFRMAVNG